MKAATAVAVRAKWPFSQRLRSAVHSEAPSVICPVRKKRSAAPDSSVDCSHCRLTGWTTIQNNKWVTTRAISAAAISQKRASLPGPISSAAPVARIASGSAAPPMVKPG